MGRAKLPRKSTNIDMTAMCDVAFLLLSFFILATKAKPAEAIKVTPPNSVASKKAPPKDLVIVTIDKSGKVFISMDEKSQKAKVAQYMQQINPSVDAGKFTEASFWGSSIAGINTFLSLPESQRIGDALTGIPVDTTKGANEMIQWMGCIQKAYLGSKLNLLLKGDNDAKYPAFKAVIESFKKNELLKFQMITNSESAPAGTELWRLWNTGDKSAREE